MADVPSNLIPTRITQLPTAPVADENSLMMIVYQGNNYQIRVGDLLSVAGVPVTRQVLAGTGLQGGGQLNANVTLSIAPGGVGTSQLATSGVTPGSYGTSTDIPVFTVDSTGRVVAATTVPATISGYVPVTREVIAGTGLTGGGPLNTNVTLNANLSNATPLVVDDTGSAGVSTEIARADHQHPAVDLSDQQQINGILPLDQGGTARSLVPNSGGIVWSGADGLYIGTPGAYGQVLVANGTDQYIWAYIDVEIPRPANTVRAGPVSGVDAIPTFRLLVNDDLPDTIDGKTFTNVDINSGTIDGTTVGASTPSTGAFTELDVDNVNIDVNTISTTNLNGNLNLTPDGTGSVVIGKIDVAAGEIDNTVIGANTPVAGSFTNVTLDQLDFDTAAVAPTDQEGRLYWDAQDNTKTLNIGMAGGQVVQQVGQELFYRVKAQGAIANGDVVMFVDTLGASVGIVAAKATGIAFNQPEYVLGVATENIANNGWGYITYFGKVRGINTTGGAENWQDGDVLYYNPAVSGGLTKFKPAVPNPIVIVAAVLYAGNNGALLVRPTYGSVLGGSDGNVSFGTLSDGNVIVYDAALQYWKNVAQSTLAVGSATTATNIAGGAAGSIPYQTASGTTSLLATGSGVLVGGTTPSYSTAPALTGTNFTAIPNAALTNSAVTIGTTSISLGASSLTLGGLTSIALTQDPVSDLQAATKQYVDGLVSTGIVYHTPVKYEVPSTTGNLNATYNNGTSGVGATLTNAGTLVTFTPDGVVAQVGDRVLIYSQTNQFENGVYEVTTVGDGATPWVLTRTTDTDSYGLNDSNTLGEGSTFFVQAGNTGAGETYTCNTSGTITFGTTAITFAQISSSQVYSAGTGLTLTGTQFSLTTPVTAGTGGTGQTSYATGDLLYATGTSTLSKLGIGASARILTSTGAAPQWSDPAGITVGSATTATTAGSATTATTSTNLAAGSAGTLPYQSAAGTTAMLAAGTADYVLKANGAAAPSWVAQSTLSVGSASTATTAASATTASNLAGGSTGALAYNSSAGTTTFLNLGTTNYVLTAGASAPQYVAQSTLSVGSATTATNLAGGAANRLVYQSGAGATTFAVAPTVSGTFLKWDGANFAWDSAGAGTVTSVNVSGGTTGLTTSGGPITSSGTITLAGTLALANGGTGATSAQAAINALAGAVTSGQYLRGNGSNVVMSAIQAGDVPTLNQNTTGSAGSVANSVTFTNTGGAAAGTTFNGSAARTIDYSTVGAPKADGTGASGTWSISISGNAATATTSTNLASGAASQIPYQTGAGTTAFIANGTSGQVLRSNGTSAPGWANIDGGTF